MPLIAIVDLEKQLATAIARAFHVSAWASYQENRGKSFPGQELMDIAPRTTPDAIAHAWRFIGTLESANGLPLLSCFCNALKRDGQDYYQVAEENADSFGHYLAMESLGHGVAWSDDHSPHGLNVPHTEFYY